MDPLLFGVNGNVVLEVIGTIVLLSLLVERALSLVFEWRLIIDKLNKRGLKEPIAFLVSLGVCLYYDFDAMAVLFSNEKNSVIGYILTAAIIAGGSKGAIKLFKDWLGWKSSAQKDIDAAQKTTKPPSS